MPARLFPTLFGLLRISHQHGEIEPECRGEFQQRHQGRSRALVFEMPDAGIAHPRRDGERFQRPAEALPLGLERRDDFLCDGCVRVWHAPRNMHLLPIGAES